MHFPSVCVDDFYSDPHSVVEFASTLDYYGDRGNYPGKRSDPINAINQDLFKITCSKIFTLFYNFDLEEVKWNISMFFQKIDAYSDDKDDLLNSGWCHLDDECIFAGVIYLNEFTNIDAGTSIYRLKNPTTDDLDYSLRNDLYLNKTVDFDEYKKSIKQHNDKFEEVLEFKNVFNRMILYDSSSYHKANSFYIDKSTSRLSIVFFVHQVTASSTPIIRKNNIILP
jgi:hypothetical protein